MHAGLAKDVIAVIFSGLASMPLLDTKKTQELACWYTKDTFGRIKHHLINPEVIKSFPQVTNQCLLLSGFHHNIIHICMYIASNLFR